MAVKCAHPDDKDLPLRSRYCDGLIVLRPDADEGGGDYRCPNCDRIVYPESYRKQKFNRLLAQHHQDGIESYLIEMCGELLAAGQSFVNGVLTLPIDGINGAVCIFDYCTDERWSQRSIAVSQPCVYVTVGPDKIAQVLDDEAIARVELVDIVLGTVDFVALLTSRVARSPRLTNIDLSVSTLGIHPILPKRGRGPLDHERSTSTSRRLASMSTESLPFAANRRPLSGFYTFLSGNTSTP